MFKSFFNWKVLLNVVVVLGLFVGLVWLAFRWLEQHTHHGEEIPVPNIMNMPVQDAVKILEEQGLKYEIDSGEFQPKYKPLQVLQIWPMANSKVKANRIVQIRVNPKTWAKVIVPNILNKYKGLAFRQLEQVGLKIGDTIYEPNIQRDAVLRMQINGPKRDVVVPNLVGITVEEAEQLIKKSLFEIGVVQYDGGNTDPSAIVYYQDPANGSRRDQGMQIDLWASKKLPAEMRNKIRELDRIYRRNMADPESQQLEENLNNAEQQPE